MKSKLLFMFALFIAMSLLTTVVEARRFGGGRSFGKSWSTPSRSSNSFSNFGARKPSSFNSGKRNMFKGALMGLVAGGLIGSLLSGGGFHGLQGLDFLLIAGAAFFIFRLFQRHKMSTSNGSSNASFYQGHSQNNMNHASSFGSRRQSTSGSTSQYPSWFNERAFVEGAKKHFMTLQQAWDQNDMQLIQTYCVADLYQSIANERAMLTGEQNTQVLSLNAKLLDVVQEGAFVVAGVEFSAEIRSNNESVERVREIWSIQHASNHGNGDWLIVGIDQR